MKKPSVSKTVNINFLPKEVQEKANQVFDRYFALGLVSKQSYDGHLPVFPNKVSSLDSNQLADIHSQYIAWLGYAADKLKYVEVVFNVINKDMSEHYDKALACIATLKINLKEKEARARGDESFKLYRNYLAQVEGLKSMLTKEVEILEKQMMGLARELRRRENVKEA